MIRKILITISAVIFIPLIAILADPNNPVSLKSTVVVQGLREMMSDDGKFATLSLSNDASPSDGQVLKWNTGNTITWENDAGAAGGDSVSVDSVAVVDPDFVSTGDIDFVDTTNTITANIKANTVDSSELVDGGVDASHLAADIVDETKIADNGIDSEHYNDGSIDLAHMSSQSVDSDNIVEGTIVEADLDSTNGPTDNYILSYNAGGSNFTWIVDGGGGSSQWTDSGTVLYPTETGDEVTVGTDTVINSSTMTINSEEDQTQVTIRADDVQTGPVVIIENSGGTQVASISKTGVYTGSVDASDVPDGEHFVDFSNSAAPDPGKAEVEGAFTYNKTTFKLEVWDGSDRNKWYPSIEDSPAWTGAHDFGGAVLEMPNGTSGTTDATGEYYMDTNGDTTNIVDEVVQMHGTDTNRYLFPMELPLAASQDNYSPKYDAATKTVQWEADADTGGAPATADISDVSVTQTELEELETIGATIISANQWTGLGGATAAGIALWDDAAASNQLVTLGLTATASEINTPLDGASVTLTEFQELEAIGATTISANQWAAIGGMAETLSSAELDRLDGIDAALVDLDDSPAWTGVHAFDNGLNINLPADDNITIDGRTNPRTVTVGAIRLNLTPEASTLNTRALFLDIDANSVPNTQGIHLDMKATGIAAGETIIGIDIVGDTVNSSGGTIRLLEFDKTGVGSAEVHAIHVEPEIEEVIHHASGTFIDPTQGWDENGGFTDITVAMGSSGTDVTIFSANADAIYIGAEAAFQEVEVVLDTGAANPGIKPTFEIWTGASYTTIVPVDGTAGFRESGIIDMEGVDLSSWASNTVNSVAKFYLRITRTQGGSLTIVEDLIQTAATTDYIWDGSGNLTINAVTASGLITANTNLSVANGATTAGVLKLFEDTDAGTNFASFQVPALGANTVYILPPDDGDNTEVLQTNGSGTLTWVTNAGGAETNALETDVPPAIENTEIFIGTGSGTGAWAAMSSDVTMANNGAVTIANNAVALTTDTTGNYSTGNAEGGDALVSIAVEISDNESTDEENPLVFVAGADPDGGDLPLETDGTCTYNPSTGEITTTGFVGALTGNSTTTTTASAGDAAVDFFGAGVDAVTDATTCTDIEGRSLTIGGGTLDIDAELYTSEKGARIESPIVEDLDKIFYFMNAVTITRVWGITDTGTVDLNIENDAGTNILSAELVCDTDEQTACAAGCDVDTVQLAQDNIAAFNNCNISISATSGSPNVVTVYIGYTIDD